MAASNLSHHIVSSAVNGANYSLQRPIILGYDSIEGYIPLLKPFICVSAMLQRRRLPDEVQFWMAASNTLTPIVSNAVN